MKKIVSILLTLVLTLSLFSFSSFAVDGQLRMHVEGAEGAPGDIVEVKVIVDENPGLWACGFEVLYNSAYLQLGDVENGKVFSDSAFEKGAIRPEGNYRYYASFNSVTGNTDKTGVLVTLRFKITEAAPNGGHEITLEKIDGRDGWMINNQEEIIPVDFGNPGIVRVTGSGASAPETKDPATTTGSADTTGTPVTEAVTDVDGSTVTEVVTDSDGNAVVDEDGNPVTQAVTQVVTDDAGNVVTENNRGPATRPVTEIVTDSDGYAVTDENRKPITRPKTEAVTDADGNPVYDADGNPVTQVVTEVIPERETTDGDSSDDAKDNTGTRRIILIVAIILLVVAACIILIVLYNLRKNGKSASADASGAASDPADREKDDRSNGSEE